MREIMLRGHIGYHFLLVMGLYGSDILVTFPVHYHFFSVPYVTPYDLGNHSTWLRHWKLCPSGK